jgi:hypothetical protein
MRLLFCQIELIFLGKVLDFLQLELQGHAQRVALLVLVPEEFVHPVGVLRLAGGGHEPVRRQRHDAS